MSPSPLRVRLLFADEGSFQHEVVSVPPDTLDGYERLIDALREEPRILERLHVDVARLVSAYVEEEGASEP